MKDDKMRYAAEIERAALMASTGGLDLEAAEAALTDLLAAIRKQAAALREASYENKSPDSVARALNHSGKSADLLFRLAQFSKGRADSRPGFPHEDKGWLQALTDEQLEIVMAWVEQTAADPEGDENEEG